jgi:hypothetical protein
VAALYLFTRGRRTLEELELVEEGQEPRSTLDVRLGRMQLRERRVTYEVDVRLRTAAA